MRRWARRVSCALGLFTLALAAEVVVHELGHHVTDWFFGRKLEWVMIFPGVRLYPDLGWEGWTRYGFAMSHGDIPGVPRPNWRYGLCRFMGAGATALTACCLLACMYRFRPGRKASFVIGVFVAVLGLNIIAYSTLPLIGLRSHVLLGGGYPEPYSGAREMGVPFWAYYSGLFVYGVALFGLLVLYLTRSAQREESAAEQQ